MRSTRQKAHLSLIVEPEVRQHLDQEAARRGLTLSQVTRDTLRRGLGIPANDSGFREGLLRGIAEAKEAISRAIHAVAPHGG